MAKAFRYTLAAICLTASVGCLGLWGWSMSHHDAAIGKNASTAYRMVGIESRLGSIRFVLLHDGPNEQPRIGWQHNSQPISDESRRELAHAIQHVGQFDGSTSQVRFPLWFVSIVFALAAVAALRVGRFTRRSAIVGTTIVAVLLGMVVIL